MVRRCECFLLDEPIAHLDARLKFSTQTALKRLSVKLGTAIIYVTHDYREALGLSDLIAVLRKGKFEQIGTPREIYNHPATDFVANFIGDPPCNLIDGTVVTQNGTTLFQVTNEFSIPLQQESIKLARKIADSNQNGEVRLGIRPSRIKVGKEKISDHSFQLPIYAMVRRPEGTVITFELKQCFFRASVKGGERYGMSEKVWLDFDQEHTFFFNKTVKITK